MSDSVRLIGGNHIGPMIVLDGLRSVPFGEIESITHFGKDAVSVKLKSDTLSRTVRGTVESVTAEINAQLAEFSRACSTMVVEIPKGGE